MRSLEELSSMYIVITLLGIGFYMLLPQRKALKYVNHLPKEARFVQIIGAIYLLIGIIGGGIALWK